MTTNQLTIPITETTKQQKEISDQLKARLDMVDKLEVALEEMREKYNYEVEQRGKVAAERDALRQLDLRNESLNEREEKLNLREQTLNQQEELNKLRLENAQTRVEDHKEMVKLIFRNPVTLRQGEIPVAVDGGEATSGQYDANGTPVMQKMPGYINQGEVRLEEENI